MNMSDLKMSTPHTTIHLSMVAILILSSEVAFSPAVRNNSSSSLNLIYWLDRSKPSWMGFGVKKSTLIVVRCLTGVGELLTAISVSLSEGKGKVWLVKLISVWM